VVVICQTIFRYFVPHVMPRNSGTNTTQENNFQAGWLRCCWKINFKLSVQKNFQAKRPLTPLRINLKKSVCQSGILFCAFSVHISSAEQNLFFVFWTICSVRIRTLFVFIYSRPHMER
jgi:hypothetical protein